MLLHRSAHNGGNPGGSIIIFQNLKCLITTGAFYGPGGDFKCPTEVFAQHISEEYSWANGDGVGLHWTHSRKDSWGPAHYTYDAYKKVAYDPKAEREQDIVIFYNSSWMARADIGNVGKAFPAMIGLGTADPEHKARRELMADMFPALLAEPGKLPPFETVNNIKNTDFKPGKKHLFEEVATPLIIWNMWRQMFGVSPAEGKEWNFKEIADWVVAVNSGIKIEEAPLPLPSPPMPFWLERFMVKNKGPEARANLENTLASDLKRTTSKLQDRLFPCAAAQKFMDEAKVRGRTPDDAEARLWEVIGTMAVAGFTGTPFLAQNVVDHMAKDPKRLVPIFRKDPKKFVLEVARLHPPVAGQNPMKVHTPKTWKMGNGKKYTEKKGELFTAWTWSANRDPKRFGGPKHDPAVANAYDYTRHNVEDLLTWNNALSDVMKCKDAAGCDEAPRPCPGIHMAIRTTIQVAEFFATGMMGEDYKSEL